MIFAYQDLKDAVREDFRRFCRMGFRERETASAVLDEYRYGEGFCRTEQVCILLFLALNFEENGLELSGLLGEWERSAKEAEKELPAELGAEYEKYAADLHRLLRDAKRF